MATMDVDMNDFIEEVDKDIPSDDVPIHQAEKTVDKFTIDNKFVSTVVQKLIADDMLPESMKVGLRTITSEELTPVLMRLEEIISTRKVFSPAAKEKALQIYQQLQPSLIDAINAILKDHRLSAFMALTAAEDLIRMHFSPSSPSSSSSSSSSTVESYERDIIAYVAGFVLFRCRQKFGSFYSFDKIFSNLTDLDGSTKLIAIKSRGGLIQPSTDAVNFFVLLEIVFRNLCSIASVPSLQQFSEAICNEDEISTYFYDITYTFDSESTLQEKLFFYAVSLYHKVRCHAKCRLTMEKFHIKTKTMSKRKALRKDIK